MNDALTAWRTVPSAWFYFQEIYDIAVATAPRGAVIVEVGSFWGQSALYLAEACKQADKDLRCYCVDLWDMRPENNKPLFMGTEWLFDEKAKQAGNIEPIIHAQYHNSLFETFAHFVDATRLSPDPLRILRMNSLEAVELLRNLSRPIWCVLLDDDHEYEHVLAELKAWAPLIAPGGMIGGDDYTVEFHGVIEATREYFEPLHKTVELMRRGCAGSTWMVRGL
jgi:cephalosporin hydroxylase